MAQSAGRGWQYMKEGLPEYRCVDCEREVNYPGVLCTKNDFYS